MMASRPMTFTERARRDQIIACTIDLISTKGYRGTSLSAIAGRAGISKAAVLYHFTSKENLAQAALEQVFQQFGDYVRERVEREADARSAVTAYVRAMIGYQSARRRHVRLITEVLLDDQDGAKLKAPGSHDAGGRWQMLAALLADGQRAGRLREFDTQTVALAIGGAIDGVISHWLAHPEMDLDSAADELERFVLAAIS